MGCSYTHGEVCERCAFGNHWAAVVRGCVPRGRVITSVYAAALWWMRRAGTLDKIDAFLCLNSFVRQKLIEAGIPEAKLAVKANSIDLTGISADYHTADYALFLGRLAPEKGLHTLISFPLGLNPRCLLVARRHRPFGRGTPQRRGRSAACAIRRVSGGRRQAGTDPPSWIPGSLLRGGTRTFRWWFSRPSPPVSPWWPALSAVFLT